MLDLDRNEVSAEKMSFFGDRRDCSAEAAKKVLPDYLSRPRGKSKLPPIAQQLLDRANLDSISMIKSEFIGSCFDV